MSRQHLAVLFFFCHSLAFAAPPPILMNLFFLTANMGEVKVADLERLLALGAAGFELPGTVSTPEDCRRLGSFVRAKKLPAALNVAVDHDRDPSSLDPQIRDAGVAYLKSRIDCAAEFYSGEPVILAGPIVLPWGYFPPKLIGPDLRRYVNEKLAAALPVVRQLADYAETRRVKLAYEPLTHWEMPGLNTLREITDFTAAVDHQNFGVCLDISHEVLDGEGPEIFAQQVEHLHRVGRLFYVQASGPNRGDLDRTWLPWREFLTPIKKVWRGPLTIEIMNAVFPFAQPGGGGLRLCREAFSDPFDVAARAISTTRAKWQSIP